MKLSVTSSNAQHQLDPKYARHCYKHLAGQVGVQLEKALVARGYLTRNDAERKYFVTDAGRHWFTDLGIDVYEASNHSQRALTRQCLDNTERQPHLAGRLGDDLLAYLLGKNHAIWYDDSRAITVTPTGKDFFRALGIEL
jgi:Peptidylarginine deiminase and related enzymes